MVLKGGTWEILHMELVPRIPIRPYRAKAARLSVTSPHHTVNTTVRIHLYLNPKNSTFYAACSLTFRETYYNFRV